MSTVKLATMEEKRPDVVIIDSSDDEDDQPPRKRARGGEATCVICLEGAGDGDARNPMLEATCCRQTGHVSCLREYYEIPAECRTTTERREIAERIGIPKCFVCRVQQSNGKTGLEEAMPALLPKVTGIRKGGRISVLEANQTLEAWFIMFTQHITTQFKHCKFLMTINTVTGWAMKRDGRIDIYPVWIRDDLLRVGAFRETLLGSVRQMIRTWAGLPVLSRKFTNRNIHRFCLDDIVEVALKLNVTNSYYSTQRPEGPDVLPFSTNKVLTVLSTWELTGHLFDFEDVTQTFNSKLARWTNTRIEK